MSQQKIRSKNLELFLPYSGIKSINNMKYKCTINTFVFLVNLINKLPIYLSIKYVEYFYYNKFILKLFNKYNILANYQNNHNLSSLIISYKIINKNNIFFYNLFTANK